MHTITVRALGGLDISHNGEALASLTPDAALLLGYLALHPGAHHTPDSLCLALFPCDGVARLEAAQQALFDDFPLSIRLFRGLSVRDASRLGCGLGVASLPPLVRLETDVQDLVQALQVDWTTLGRREAAALLTEAAAAIERGLLPGVQGAWVDDWRERLCTLFRTASVGVLAAEERPRAAVRAGRLFAGGGAPLPVRVASVASGEVAEGCFYGRERELAELRELLEQGERVLNLVGLGGVGKSRLALALLESLPERFATWRVATVCLGNVTTRAGLLEALRRSLGQQTGDVFQDGRDLIGQVCRALQEPTLLYLDNVEDAVRTPDGEVVQALGYLTYRCPETVLLTTSRCRIGLPEEYVYPVEGLALPGESELTSAATLDEFQERFPALSLLRDALKASGKFSLPPDEEARLLRLVRYSGGLPLSIELLATRVAAGKALPDEKELQACAGSPQGVIDWALQPLSEPTRLFLRHLGVFHGPFTVEDAEAVTGEEEAAFRLSELDDAGLLVALSPDGLLYRLTDAVRDSSRDALSPDDFATLQSRHAEYYAGLVRKAESQFRDLDWREFWMTRIPQCVHEVLGAVRYLLNIESQILLAAETALAASPFLAHDDRVQEGTELIETVLRKTEGITDFPEVLRIDLRDALGRFYIASCRWDDAFNELNSVYPKLLEQGDSGKISRISVNMGILLDKYRRYDEAQSYYREALSRIDVSRQPSRICTLYLNISYGLMEMGRWQDACENLAKASEIAEKSGDKESLIKVAFNYAECLYVTMRQEEARKQILRVIESVALPKNLFRLACSLALFGLIEAERGENLDIAHTCLVAGWSHMTTVAADPVFDDVVKEAICKKIQCLNLKELPVFSEKQLTELKKQVLSL